MSTSLRPLNRKLSWASRAGLAISQVGLGLPLLGAKATVEQVEARAFFCNRAFGESFTVGEFPFACHLVS